jgi:hypothetical protein
MKDCQCHRKHLKLADKEREASGVITLLDGNLKPVHSEYLSDTNLLGKMEY